MPNKILIVAISLLLGACQQIPVSDEASPHSRLEIGTNLILNQRLQVPAGHARVFIQDGRVRAKSRLRRYYPHCEFELRSVSDGSHYLEPDSFKIIGVEEDEVDIVRQDTPRRYAATTMVVGGETIPQLNRFVRYRLYSEYQAEVLNLTCYSGFDDPWLLRYPSIQQMRETLGGVVSIGREESGEE